jgi:pyrroline-5-carboxylate reductase
MKKIVFYGSGNISQAIVSGLILSGYDKNLIEFVDRNKINSKRTIKLGVKKTKLKSIDSKSIIYLSVKPKDAINAYTEICSVIKKPKIVSLVAGIKSNKYLYKSKDIQLIRAMPNTSSKSNKGITAIYNCSANKTTFNQVLSIFKKVGITIEITKESKIDDFTGLIGSGPAYFFYLLKVYEKRILKLCNNDKSKKDIIICNLLEGVSNSISDNSNLDELIASVASKKGTTEAGLMSFKSSKLSQNFEKGITAAIKRAKDISVEF